MSGFQIKMFSWCFEQYSFSHNVIVLFWWLIIIILSGWVATWGNLKTQTTGQMLLIRNNVPLSILFFVCTNHKIPCITRKVKNIQICLLGKSFWRAGCRMLNNRGWMNPVTTLSLILSNYQFVSTINTRACPSYTSLLRQFLCVTHRLHRIGEIAAANGISLESTAV